MDFFQSIVPAIFLGIVQGITEFLPISSSGHLILVRELFGLSSDNTLGFDIFLNTATLFAVLYCFRGDIFRIFRDLKTEGLSSRSKNLIFCIILGTIPAVIVGYKYSDSIENIFRNSHFVAYALLAGSLLMFIADKVNSSKNIGSHGVTPIRSFIIGIFQTLAFLPGMSRSGSSISGGLITGLSREEAVRFSFLLYIPISLGAALKSIIDSPSFTVSTESTYLVYIFAFLAALISGVWAIKFMVRYLSKNSFTPFIIYRILVAISIFIFL